jgi:hypothetical protein
VLLQDDEVPGEIGRQDVLDAGAAGERSLGRCPAVPGRLLGECPSELGPNASWSGAGAQQRGLDALEHVRCAAHELDLPLPPVLTK